MPVPSKLIGIFGGTFDPVHFGHLRMAQELAETIGLSEVRFIPCATPPHRDKPMSEAHHRATMVRLAIANNPLFRLDEQELRREGASYTYDTLVSLRRELGAEVSLCLLIGSDAFLKLDTWHRWDELLQFCHLVVAHRPNAEPHPEKMSLGLRQTWQGNLSTSRGDLVSLRYGKIFLQKITALDISATAIREDYHSGTSPRYLLPDNVMDYIRQHSLY